MPPMRLSQLHEGAKTIIMEVANSKSEIPTKLSPTQKYSTYSPLEAEINF